MDDNDDRQKNEKAELGKEKREQVSPEPPKAEPPKKEAKSEEGVPRGEAAKLTAALNEALAEASRWKNEYYLSLADTQNLRKSIQDEHRDALKYRAAPFLEGLLPALDSFYSALQTTPNGEEAKNYKQGFQYIYNQLLETLKSEGMTEVVPAPGDRYDPSCMHAIDVVEGEKDNTIALVYAKGYLLHDRLIRPAMVQVYKKAPVAADAKTTPEAAAKKDSEAHKA